MIDVVMGYYNNINKKGKIHSATKDLPNSHLGMFLIAMAASSPIALRMVTKY